MQRTHRVEIMVPNAWRIWAESGELDKYPGKEEEMTSTLEKHHSFFIESFWSQSSQSSRNLHSPVTM